MLLLNIYIPISDLIFKIEIEMQTCTHTKEIRIWLSKLEMKEIWQCRQMVPSHILQPEIGNVGLERM